MVHPVLDALHLDVDSVLSLPEMRYVPSYMREGWILEAGSGGGVRAEGVIAAEPSQMLFPDAELGFILDAAQVPNTMALRVPIHVSRIPRRPITKDRLRENETLSGLSVLRAPQGTNFPVRKAEAVALEDMITASIQPAMWIEKTLKTGRPDRE